MKTPLDTGLSPAGQYGPQKLLRNLRNVASVLMEHRPEAPETSVRIRLGSYLWRPPTMAPGSRGFKVRPPWSSGELAELFPSSCLTVPAIGEGVGQREPREQVIDVIHITCQCV